MEVGRFGWQAYTLMHDHQHTLFAEGLDVTFCVFPHHTSTWGEGWGGEVHYVTQDEPLLNVPPQGNALSLVFRERGLLTFTKYINHQVGGSAYAPQHQYYRFSMIAREPASADDAAAAAAAAGDDEAQDVE